MLQVCWPQAQSTSTLGVGWIALDNANTLEQRNDGRLLGQSIGALDVGWITPDNDNAL
jgi:hypothetical protein